MLMLHTAGFGYAGIGREKVSAELTRNLTTLRKENDDLDLESPKEL